MANIRKLYVGEIGKRVRVKVNTSLAHLSTATLYVEKPDGATASEWAASVLGAEEDGILYYDTTSGDLNTQGIYRLYVKLVFTDGRTLFGERTYFTVYDPSEG